jgi:thioester reductase-like protein
MEVLQRSNGYSQTKFVAEELVSMFASRQSKNHVSIVRPGLIIGTEKEGIPNIDDFQWKLVQVCLQMGSYPMEEGNLWLSVADVEEVATTILNSAFETAQQNAATPSVVDVETGSTVSQFWDMVQETTGTKLKPMKPEPWKEAAENFLESDDLFRPLLAIVKDSQQGFGLHKPEGAESLRPEVIKRNVQTLVDIGFLSTAHSPGGFNLSGSNKAGNMAAFNRSRRQ